MQWLWRLNARYDQLREPASFLIFLLILSLPMVVFMLVFTLVSWPSELAVLANAVWIYTILATRISYLRRCGKHKGR